jgi:hypothetical protein
MTNLTVTIDTAELLKLIHRGQARLRGTPKETDRYAELKELLDCAVSVMALHIRDEKFEAPQRIQALVHQLQQATALHLEVKTWQSGT